MHRFMESEYKSPFGHPYCAICGNEEPNGLHHHEDGDCICNGCLNPDGTRRAPASEEGE